MLESPVFWAGYVSCDACARCSRARVARL